jgi:uncharacterized membrane protein YgcG
MRSATIVSGSAVLVAALACNRPATSEGGAVDSVASAAWYDGYQQPEPNPSPGYLLYEVPRHTTCAEMELGNASAMLEGPIAGARSCVAQRTHEVSLGDADRVTVTFGSPEGTDCQNFDWSATRPLVGIVVRTSPELGSPALANVWRYHEPRPSGSGGAPLAVDGQHAVGAVEFCFEVKTDGSSSGSSGSGSSTPHAGAGSSGGDGSSGKTW